jgi:hypothetical protein
VCGRYIHPLEAFGYYCILYSAAFVVPMHTHTFLAYMAILGTFGILDHSGIKFRVPLVGASSMCLAPVRLALYRVESIPLPTGGFVITSDSRRG